MRGMDTTISATFRYRGEGGSSNFYTIAKDIRDGLTSARCCNYSYVLLMMSGVTTRNM